MVLIILCCMRRDAGGEYSLISYESAGTIPFDGRAIIVGTVLIVIISSDSNNGRDDRVLIIVQDRASGISYVRNYTSTPWDSPGLPYEAAGDTQTGSSYCEAWMGNGIFNPCRHRADDDGWRLINFSPIDIATNN